MPICFSLHIGAMVAAACMISSSCALSDPEVHEALSCERNASESVRQGKQEVMVDCSVPSPWAMVGVPSTGIGSQELTALGLPAALVDLVNEPGENGARWCLAREVPTQPVPEGTEQTTARSICVKTATVLTVPVVVQSGKVRFSFERLETGQARLVTAEPLGQ
jgi:hypothetical protein